MANTFTATTDDNSKVKIIVFPWYFRLWACSSFSEHVEKLQCFIGCQYSSLTSMSYYKNTNLFSNTAFHSLQKARLWRYLSDLMKTASLNTHSIIKTWNNLYSLKVWKQTPNQALALLKSDHTWRLSLEHSFWKERKMWYIFIPTKYTS